MLPSIVGAVQATQPYVVRIVEPPAAVPIDVGDVIVSALGAVGVATIAAFLLGGSLAFRSLYRWRRNRRPEEDHMPSVAPNVRLRT